MTEQTFNQLADQLHNELVHYYGGETEYRIAKMGIVLSDLQTATLEMVNDAYLIAAVGFVRATGNFNHVWEQSAAKWRWYDWLIWYLWYWWR